MTELIKTNYTQAGKGKRYKFAGFEIEGLDELIKAFAELPDDAIYKLADPSVAGAKIVLEKAKQNTHDVTGELDRALKVKKPGRDKKNHKRYRIFATVGYTKKGAHGAPLEMGHRLVFMGHKTYKFIPAKPFMRPAAKESENKVADIMADAMGRIIDEMGGRR